MATSNKKVDYWGIAPVKIDNLTPTQTITPAAKDDEYLGKPISFWLRKQQEGIWGAGTVSIFTVPDGYDFYLTHITVSHANQEAAPTGNVAVLIYQSGYNYNNYGNDLMMTLVDGYRFSSQTIVKKYPAPYPKFGEKDAFGAMKWPTLVADSIYISIILEGFLVKRQQK